MENNNNEETTSIWEQTKSTTRKMTMAERVKQSTQKKQSSDMASRAAKFIIADYIEYPEIIKYFQNKFKDESCVEQLQKMPAPMGSNRWNVVFSKAEMVEKVLDILHVFPSMEEGEVGVALEAVQRRATLITIPYATPDIPAPEIMRQLSEYGHITRAWAHSYEDFPAVKSGKKLVLIIPYAGKTIPPILIIKNEKILLSFKGRPTFCMHCQTEDHRSGECDSKWTRTCYLCGSPDHVKRDCPQKDNPSPPTTDPRDEKAEDHKRVLVEHEENQESETAAETEPENMDLTVASPVESPVDNTVEGPEESPETGPVENPVASPVASPENNKPKKTQNPRVREDTEIINAAVEDMLQSKAARAATKKRPIQSTPEKPGKKKSSVSKKLALSKS